MSNSFIAVLVVWCIVAPAFTGFLCRTKRSGRQVIGISALVSFCAIPAAAVAVGSFYSHGFTIAWYVYGAVISLVSFAVSMIIYLVFIKKK